MPEQTKETDEYPLSKLEEFVRLKLEFDRRFGSLSGAQLFTTVATFVLIVLVLGFIAGVLAPGSPFGTIIALALAASAVVGMSKGIEKNNIRDFLEDQRELGLDENPKVYVDAKIKGRHEKGGPKQTFVAYVVGDHPSLAKFTEIESVRASGIDSTTTAPWVLSPYLSHIRASEGKVHLGMIPSSPMASTS